jgi:putative endonuclease
MEGLFWVYILENPKRRLYIGSTDDSDRRFAEHNSDRGFKTFTHKNGPWNLVWKESHPSRGESLIRERQIKSMKSAKWIRENLLNGKVPASQD